MADFYPLLDRAIGGLPDNNPEARNALFARARDVLLAQLRGMDPPLPEADIAHEMAALEEVIARVEREHGGPAPQPATPAPAPAPGQAPPTANAGARPAVSPAATPPQPTSASPAPQGRPTPAPAQHGQAPGGPAQPAAPGLKPPTLARTSAAGAVHPANPPQTASTSPAAPASGAAPQPGPASPRPAQGAPHDGAASRAPSPELGTPSDNARLRPPTPPRPPGKGKGGGKRNALIGGFLVVALAGVAGVAYWANKVNQPVPQQAEAPAAGAVDPDNDQKFAQRVDGDKTTGATTGNQAGQNGATAQQGQAVAGVQRAILYEETPDNPQTPKVFQGRVTWRLDSENPGQNQPLENVVRADVTIPEAGLDIAITLRRNTDAALPASHLMELTFRKGAEGEGRIIRDVGVPQFKTEENARGVPLAGLPVAVSESVFLVGLSNLPNDVERNVDLIRNRPWIDLPVRYDNGRRAVIALEKGASGEQVMAEAFKGWSQ